MTELRLCSVVASIEETANRFDIPKMFIGLILIPIVVSMTGATSLGASFDSLRRQMPPNS